VLFVLVPSFHKIYANQIVDLYSFKVGKMYNTFIKRFFSLFSDELILNLFLICPTMRSDSRHCFGLQGKRCSESKIRRPEFLSAQVGNPTPSLPIRLILYKLSTSWHPHFSPEHGDSMLL
jgi:hypothetical protein